MLEGALAAFKEYVGCFEQEIAVDQASIDLKREHSLRVLAEARSILGSLNLPVPLARLVELAALFHDIGRFPQFAAHGTFDDQQSVNHGLLGYKILKENGFLGHLAKNERKRVLLTVLLHNRIRVVQGLPQELDTMLRVVRDADKLDAVAVLIAHFEQGAEDHGVVSLNLSDEPGYYSPRAMQRVLSGQMVGYNDMACINDFKLLLLSWVYDLNFAHSRREFVNRGYVSALTQSLPGTRETEALQDRLLGSLSAVRAVE